MFENRGLTVVEPKHKSAGRLALLLSIRYRCGKSGLDSWAGQNG